MISFKVFLLEEISEIRVNDKEWNPNKANEIFKEGNIEDGVTTHTIQYMHEGQRRSLHFSFSESDDEPDTHVLTLYGEFGDMTPTRHGGVFPIAHILAHAISHHLDNHPNKKVNFFDFHSTPGRDLYATLIRRLKRLGEQLGLEHESVQDDPGDPNQPALHIIRKRNRSLFRKRNLIRTNNNEET